MNGVLFTSARFCTITCPGMFCRLFANYRLLENLDTWLSARDRDSGSGVSGTGRNIAGLGIYYFEEPHDENDETD